MKTLLVLPIVVPLMTAATGFLLWKRRDWQRVLGVAGAAIHLALAIALLLTVDRHGIQSVQIGSWPAPFGITLVADLLSAIMLVLAGIMGLGVVVYSLAQVDNQRESFGYYPLIMVLIMGVSGAFLTGDIFNLYVWFEVLLMASFVLMALGGERAQLEGSIKYVTLNLISSAFFLAAVGILYGEIGALNMADLAVKLSVAEHPRLITTVAMLFLIAFGIKAAMFPLFFWLPASYHTPPVAVTALFAGLLTKVGAYSLIRVFTLIFVQETAQTHAFILTLAGLTMVTGVLGAAAQNDFRRILAFHIVSQIGYIIMGLGVFTPLALAGSVYFFMHNILAKANLFLIAGVAERIGGSYNLKKLGGLYLLQPFLSILFLVSALSLAGLPPSSGFWGKLTLIKAGLDAREYVIVATALAVSLLTLYSMTKIWTTAFWGEAAAARPPQMAQHWTRIPGAVTMLIPVVAIALCTLVLGFMPEWFLGLSSRASEQLMNPAHYIEAVLGDRP